MKGKTPDIKQLIRQKISEVDPDAEVILYGSRARGDDKKDSDWDVLILVNNPRITNAIEDSFRERLYDLELNIEQIISVQIYSKKYWKNKMVYSPLFNDIAKEGIRL